MAESTIADLQSIPSVYQSSRGLWDVLFGVDNTAPLIDAILSNDNDKLRSMLSQQQWIDIALEEPYRIYSEDRPSHHKIDVRGVLAMKFLNLDLAMIKASITGNAAAVATLLDFASQQGLIPKSLLTRWALCRGISTFWRTVFPLSLFQELRHCLWSCFALQSKNNVL